MSYKANCRIGKVGPPPHCAFILCINVRGVQVHLPGVTHENTMEPVFDYARVMPCNTFTCKGWHRINERGLAWFRSLSARRAIEDPGRLLEP